MYKLLGGGNELFITTPQGKKGTPGCVLPGASSRVRPPGLKISSALI